MATRSTISIVDTRTKDGQGRSIYCHWDGYPSNNGLILLESYTNPDKINALMDLGDISSLADNVAPKKEGVLRKWNSEKVDYDLFPTTQPHSFDSPHDGVVVAYMRDRGEENCGAVSFKGKEPGKNIAQEFDYLFVVDKNKWYVRNNHHSKPKFVELTRKMCED